MRLVQLCLDRLFRRLRFRRLNRNSLNRWSRQSCTKFNSLLFRWLKTRNAPRNDMYEMNSFFRLLINLLVQGDWTGCEITTSFTTSTSNYFWKKPWITVYLFIAVQKILNMSRLSTIQLYRLIDQLQYFLYKKWRKKINSM